MVETETFGPGLVWYWSGSAMPPLDPPVALPLNKWKYIFQIDLQIYWNTSTIDSSF